MYDYIIAGGGCAGLTLAHRLSQQLDAPFRLLLIDQERKATNDRTWCFWHMPHPPYEELVSHRWSHIQVRNSTATVVRRMEPYSYYMIRSADFYRHVNADLDRDPRIIRIYGQITDISDCARGDCAAVTVDGARHRGGWVFDSTFEPRAFVAALPQDQLLLQHFYGQFVEFDADLCDPTVATLFDFRTGVEHEMQFMYVLPLSARRALIEHTVFSRTPYAVAYYESAIARYIGAYMTDARYRVLADERGIIPMTAHRFPRYLGRRVVAIGTKGGRVKSSTGFAFLRMQHDADLIAATLKHHRPMTKMFVDKRVYRLLDAMIINVAIERATQAQAVFFRLFARNSIHRIFALLDEWLPLSQTLRLMSTMPRVLFIGAFLRILFKRLTVRSKRLL